MMIALLASACSGNERTVSGQLATDQFGLKGAQAVAIDEVGQTYRVPVADDGRFALALPVGKTYSVRFANSTTKPGVYDAFAVLVNHDTAGDAHRHFRLTAGSTIDLGRVRQSNTRSLALTAADSDDSDDSEDDSDSSDDDDGDSSGDDDSDSDSSSPIEADVDQICDLSGGDDMVSVSGTTSALEATDGDDDGISDADDDDSDSDSDGCDDSDSDDSDSDSDDGMTGTSSTSDDADSEDDSDSDSDSDSSGHSNDCDAPDAPSDDQCGTPPGEGAPDADVPPVEGNQSPGTGGV